MQHQQHVEDKEEVMSIPEDIIVRNSEKKTTNRFQSSFTSRLTKESMYYFKPTLQFKKTKI